MFWKLSWNFNFLYLRCSLSISMVIFPNRKYFIYLINYTNSLIFSSSELKAQVSYSDRLLSVVCLSVRLSVNFYIFDFFSRTTGPILTKLGTNHPWGEGIQVCSNKGDYPSSRGDNSKRVKIHNFFKNLLLQNQQAEFNQTWYTLSLGKGNSSLFK
jgi:hypothetical protein